MSKEKGHNFSRLLGFFSQGWQKLCHKFIRRKQNKS